jgi:hypothetical protein
MKKTIIYFLSLALLATSTNTSQAIQGGMDAFGDPHAVKVGFGGHGGCGGFLYAPRIVLTAQHCLHNPLNSPPTLMEPHQLDVFAPGSLLDRSISAEKFFLPTGFTWYNTGGYSTFGKDFAVVVLSKPHLFQGETRIADESTIQKYINDQTQLTIVGFGRRFKGDDFTERPPAKINVKLASREFSDAAIEEYKKKFNRKGVYGPTVHAYIPKGDVMTCDGDSGSPLFFRDGNTSVYVGASSTIVGTLNCGADDAWFPNGGMQSVEAAFLYSDLIIEAEKYVQEHPYVSDKFNFRCQKGKTVINFFQENPQCPTGYAVYLKNGAKPKQGKKCELFGMVSGKFTCATYLNKDIWFKITLDKPKEHRPIVLTKCLTNELEALGYDKYGFLTNLICTYKNAPGDFPSWMVNEI